MRRERSQNVIICLSSHLFDLLWSLGPSPSRQKGFRSQGPSCPVDEQPQWPSGLPLSASAGTASLLPVSWGSIFPWSQGQGQQQDVAFSVLLSPHFHALPPYPCISVTPRLLCNF